VSGFSAQACFIHPGRESVALCLECRHSFCRECVVDHDGRLICAGCLARMQASSTEAHHGLRALAQTAGVLAALILCWMLFYSAGRALLITEPARHTFSSEP